MVRLTLSSARVPSMPSPHRCRTFRAVSGVSGVSGEIFISVYFAVDFVADCMVCSLCEGGCG